MKYRTQLLGPVFVATAGFIVASTTGQISLNTALQGITAVSTLTLTVMMYKWADME